MGNQVLTNVDLPLIHLNSSKLMFLPNSIWFFDCLLAPNPVRSSFSSHLSLYAERMKMIPNTTIAQLTLISHKRLPLTSGNNKCSIGISEEIPYIHAYHKPKIRNIEPTTTRNIPAMRIDFLLNNILTFNPMIHHFKLY